MAAVGLLLFTWGSIWLGQTGDLAERTEQAIGVLAGGSVQFTDSSGAVITAALPTDCKRRAKNGRGCRAFFEDGDEVLVWYDAANPERIWYGSTPGGFWAAVFLFIGTSLSIGGLLGLWFETPWYRRLQAWNTKVREERRRPSS